MSDNITYELAKILRDLGFNLPCTHYYTSEDAPEGQVWLTVGDAEDYNNYNDTNPFLVPVCSAPSYHTALEWMREKYKVHCFAVVDDDCEEGQEEIWKGVIQRIEGGLAIPIKGNCKSWSEAVEAALQYAIIIES